MGLKKSEYITIFILVAVIGFALFMERRDLYENLSYKVFKSGNIETLYEYTVYWRRSLIISSVILLLCLGTGVIKFSVCNVLTFLVISMLIIYFQFNFFIYHQDKYILKSFNCTLDPEKRDFYAKTDMMKLVR